MQAKNIIRS